MRNLPGSISIARERGTCLCVREADVGVARQVREQMNQSRSWLLKALAKLVHGERDVGSRRSRGVHEAANALLERTHALRIFARVARQGIHHALHERVRVGQRALLHVRERALGQEARDDLLDVFALMELDSPVAQVLHLDAKEILHWTLVNNTPGFLERCDKLVVVGASKADTGGIQRHGVDDLQIVNVDADGYDLAVGTGAGEDAGIRVIQWSRALLHRSATSGTSRHWPMASWTAVADAIGLPALGMMLR